MYWENVIINLFYKYTGGYFFIFITSKETRLVVLQSILINRPKITNSSPNRVSSTTGADIVYIYIIYIYIHYTYTQIYIVRIYNTVNWPQDEDYTKLLYDEMTIEYTKMVNKRIYYHYYSFGPVNLPPRRDPAKYNRILYSYIINLIYSTPRV